MPGAVKCNVEECIYYEGVHCTADSILIKSNGNPIVGTVRGTMCDTFSYRNPGEGSRP